MVATSHVPVFDVDGFSIFGHEFFSRQVEVMTEMVDNEMTQSAIPVGETVAIIGLTWNTLFLGRCIKQNVLF